MEEKKEHDLYIPEYVPDRREIISGFRKEEMTIVGAVSGLMILICLFAALNRSDYLIFCIMGSCFAIAITIVTVRLNRAGENLITQLKIFLNYRKAQKQYIYHYTDPYMKEEEIYEEDDREEADGQ
ncbi:hypothetical protein [Fusibacillus kribbianus]|uniref:PrgI family protein n=1 Tax=Fusibacillus kribbianus TaxID=3044208 RepID=A0AAP4EXK6_9FIRM|nr:hypothetical protein [Ruminococcus sp. YH-rum2234]MDI9241917.1 hypothetical protein [Ruminococcus sp. YH-rum2234]